MPYCSILFILSEQYSLSWRTSIVVCPDGRGEGYRVSLEHLQSTVLRRACVTSSSVARGGGGEGLEPPHWLVKCAKSHVFCAFEADFMWKMENSPPHSKTAPPQTSELAKLDDISFFFFFFGDHLILGGKNVWISDSGRKITLNSGEDLFFFFFFLGGILGG